MQNTLKFLSFLLLCCCVNLTAQQNKQRTLLFDDNWKFSLGDIPQAKNLNFDDKTWRSLDLPHDWSIEGKISSDNPTRGAGGYFPAGIGWYRKTFNVPTSLKGKRVSIYFEGVYMNSEVFINGKSLGTYPYGYSSFMYDLTPYLDFSKENILSVKVDNSQQQNCRWYSGSGIYRHVWMTVTDELHIAHQGAGITTPEITAEKATVAVKVKIKNESKTAQQFTLNTQLFDDKARKSGNAKLKVDLAAGDEKEVEQTIVVSKPQLWDLEKPHLYKIQIQILKENKITDQITKTFGIRSIKFTVENGFQLNGKTIKLNGGCVHHDNGILGAAAYDRAEERKSEMMKSAGFNAIRTSHNPPSETFLDACDRLGILIIDEAFDGWKESKTAHDYASIFNDWWQRDLESMIARDRNHPSIIMWSIGNEIIERKSPDAIQTAKMMAVCIRKIDNTRPITSAMTTWDKDWEIFDPLFAAHDIGGYNYQLHRAPADHARVPSRVIVQTESYPRDAFENWKLVQQNNYIIGDFVWTALDYLGESGIGRWFYNGEKRGEHWEGELFPWHGAYCGDVDLTGWRKPISHYRSMLYNENEKLYMAVREPNVENLEIKETMWSVWPTWESWNWPGFEHKNIEVEVYSKYPEVRLYLNDKLIGEEKTSQEQQFKAKFAVPYSSGTLRAAGVISGKEVEFKTLKTADNPVKIKLTADRKIILANGQDLSYITVEVTDKNGNIVPNAANKLQFDIEGEGTIAGVGNANLKDIDQYAGNNCKVWNGRAQVIIKSTHKKGNIILKASSSGLAESSITIKGIINK